MQPSTWPRDALRFASRLTADWRRSFGIATVLRRDVQKAPELKSVREIGLMREAGKLVARALRLCREMAKPGVKTFDINRAVEDLYTANNATPLFKGYDPAQTGHPFPAVTCLSLNEQVVHGIPGHRPLRD